MPPLRISIDTVARAAALAVAVAAAMTLVGWLGDRPELARWGAGAIAMQANTALATVALAVALALSPARSRASLALASLALAIGAATLFEHLSGIALGIDELLARRDWGSAATVVPGRMGPLASLSLTLLATATALAALHWPERWRSIAAAFAAMTLCIASVPLLGYLYGAASLYSQPESTGIAVQTVVSLLVISFALLVRVRARDALHVLRASSGAGLLARTVLPAVVIVPVVLGWLRMRAQQSGWFGPEIGAALFVLAVIIWSGLVLWWGVQAVDARERAMVELGERQRMADLALANARDQVTVVDRDWRYVYVNERVLELNQASRESLLGASLWAKYPQLAGSEFETVARRAMAKRTRETLDYLHPVRHRWYEVRMEPTPDGGLVFLALDLTERKLLEDELALAAQRKDEFLATLAHELRNPLAPIRTALEIIKRAKGDPAMIERARSTAERQLTLVVRLIDDLLDVSRITRNRLELRRERVTLAEVVSDAVATTQPQFQAAGAKLSLEIPSAPLLLDVDPVRLAQVFANLLGNAVKYSERDCEVRLSARAAHGMLEVAVSDHGIGIAPDMLETIFGMFVQADSSLQRSRGGLGIGLTLVRQLVSLHGGEVIAASAGPGQGSTFTVRLPLAAEASAQVQDEVLAPPA